MTLAEQLRLMIVTERNIHHGSNTDLAIGREMILKMVEGILETHNDKINKDIVKGMINENYKI